MSSQKNIYIIDNNSLNSKYGQCPTGGNTDITSQPSTLPSTFFQQSDKSYIFQNPEYIDKITKKYDEELLFPLKDGKINDYEQYIYLLENIIDKLKIQDISSAHLLLTEQEIISDREREILTEILFEKFKFKGVFLAKKPVCAIYADKNNTEKTGLVFYSGDSFTSVTPVYDGYSVRPFTRSNTYINIGGFNLLKNISEKANTLFTYPDNKIVFDFLTLYLNDFTDLSSHESITKESTQDRDEIKISNGITSFSISKQEILDTKVDGNIDIFDIASDLLNSSIDGLDAQLQESLLKNIVLVGRTTMFSGFKEQFIQKTNDQFKYQQPIKYFSSDGKINPANSIWYGASNLINSPGFEA
ncbi:hypothetical protein TRFO_10592 [Tritrichomonas foetus]|uniref:Actin n=1 Tax=Tritrichomonas foetus TaxID=1144522 RepID=A0A1J4JCN8_9EUKA|nr:hypothetical protein TRFO_10592 [Tritrichomonas foetus]|eukprot:OHS95427.1 hypothetical protein TRFO_10592 [Tritrichomonas foetus]